MTKVKPQIYYERAERLKSVRLLANLKRNEFAQLADVSPTTVSFWENVTHTGLTEDGAIKTVAALDKLGILCTVPWLMFGAGDAPYKEGQEKRINSSISPHVDDKLSQEIATFQRQKNAAILTLHDDAMSPLFLKGDIVGGLWQEIGSINVNERLTCIVEFNNSLLVRKIRASGLNKYDLYALCLDTDSSAPYEIRGVSLTRIAPVSRLWRNY